MAQLNLKAGLAMTSAIEGGFWMDPVGGPTSRGITQSALAAWRKRPVSLQEVKDLTQDEAQEIFTDDYAAPISFNDLPNGLDVATLDFSVHSGASTAAKHLQAVVGAKVDGVIRSKTLAAVAAMPLMDVINALCDERLLFMQTLRNWEPNKNGWRTRVDTVRRQALALSVGKVPEPVQLEPTPKADATAATITSSASGKSNLIAMVGAAGVAATVLAGQLDPFSGVKWVQMAAVALTMAGTMAGLAVTMARLKSGQGAV